jgi:hypothetical protein
MQMQLSAALMEMMFMVLRAALLPSLCALLVSSGVTMADQLEIQMDGTASVKSVAVEVTNPTTGAATETDLTVKNVPADATATAPTKQDDAQVVNIQTSSKQCVVDLEVTSTQGKETDIDNVDICVLDGLTVENVVEVPKVVTATTQQEGFVEPTPQ